MADIEPVPQQSSRSEIDTKIEELFDQYQVAKSESEPKGKAISSLKGRIVKEEERQRMAQQERLQYDLENLMRTRPGMYPLIDLKYIPGLPESQFTFGFNYPVGEDGYEVGLWRYNRWGIAVVKHSEGYSPQIEILSEGDPRRGPTGGNTLIHLPEGYKIPVGPLKFEEDSVPATQEDMQKTEAAKRQALKLAKKMGVKVGKDPFKDFERFGDPFEAGRSYPKRYFLWQPVLPETPKLIAIDFDAIQPIYMGLNLEAAPVFNNTLTFIDETYESNHAKVVDKKSGEDYFLDSNDDWVTRDGKKRDDDNDLWDAFGNYSTQGDQQPFDTDSFRVEFTDENPFLKKDEKPT